MQFKWLISTLNSIIIIMECLDWCKKPLLALLDRRKVLQNRLELEVVEDDALAGVANHRSDETREEPRMPRRLDVVLVLVQTVLKCRSPI